VTGISRLAIVGTGLIGASVGLAAKRVGVPSVVGWDASGESLGVARERGARVAEVPDQPEEDLGALGEARERGEEDDRAHQVLDLADAAGFDVASPRDPARRGGAVILDVPEAAAVYAELEERAILCDFRPGAGIRLGPHYFTTDDELRHAVDQIAEILETGAHERHLGVVANH